MEDGKLAGGNPGLKLTLDAVDKVTFRPAEMPAATITFNVEHGRVISLTFSRGGGSESHGAETCDGPMKRISLFLV